MTGLKTRDPISGPVNWTSTQTAITTLQGQVTTLQAKVASTVSANTQTFSTNVAKAEAENLQTTVNAILTALKAAGLMTA